MTKITVNSDCGNAPKISLLKNFNIAFAKGDPEFIIKHVSDDIKWTMVGDKTIEGKKHFSQEINKMKEYVADELIIHAIIMHGHQAALNGEMKMGGKTYAFCDVYCFTSASSLLIKEMKSYIIEVKHSALLNA